jgi:hypothetical protein
MNSNKNHKSFSETEAEQLKKELLYDPNPCVDETEEEIEFCDYTGEECIGNKLFCEECPVLTEDWGKERDRECSENCSHYDNLNRCCWLVTEKGISIHVNEGDLCHHSLKDKVS